MILECRKYSYKNRVGVSRCDSLCIIKPLEAKRISFLLHQWVMMSYIMNMCYSIRRQWVINIFLRCSLECTWSFWLCHIVVVCVDVGESERFVCEREC